MKTLSRFFGLLALCILSTLSAKAVIEGSLDPPSVVAQWSNESTYKKIIDINFSDLLWPDTWKGETGRDCPSYEDGGYVNAIINVPANGGDAVKYPVLFHNCTFANKQSAGGFGGATAAFSRQYYLGEPPCGIEGVSINNWTVAGHTGYLEDNITYNALNIPTHGEAGFVQMCRDAFGGVFVDGKPVSRHGWMEIDHIPYVERIQWSWSSTSWGRGIKCDIKIGDGEWTPLVWMGSEQHEKGYTLFSDQGYFMENVINASDVSLRWRVWDGEILKDPVQTTPDGGAVFVKGENPNIQQQAPRVHKIRIFGNEITAEQAQYAIDHPVGNVGELSDIGGGGDDPETPAPDDDAPIVTYVVAQDGTGQYAKIQDAIDAVPSGSRGIIYIRPGVYEENVYSGTKTQKDKYISLVGEDRDRCILTSSVNRGPNGTTTSYLDCTALNVYTQRFYAENLTIRNTSGNVGQAEALFTHGDAHIFNNCVISGYQDTYKANIGARGYFTRCTIEGATDFIYDSGLEWFDNCTLRCLKGGGYVTAAADAGLTLSKVMHPNLTKDKLYAGLFFSGCTVTAEDGVADGAYYLGRPWKEMCGTMFLNCKLGKHINAKGWKEWSGAENKCSYLEYNNTDLDGNALNLSERAAFSYQANDVEVAEYLNPQYLFKKFSDVPFNYAKILRGAAAPTGFVVTPTGFTWQADEQAAGYLVYKDGQFAAFTAQPEYTKTDGENDQAIYTVRSVSRHGVTSHGVFARAEGDILAFPTAGGFGKYATGGRGGKVVTVTSLDDVETQKGTLRWAFKQYPDEPLTIVFAVSGEIALRSDLRVNRADWTLAGQTAPGDGIVITRNKVNFGGSQNFIVRNMRFRVGQKNYGGDINAVNAVGAENCANYIFDHCDFGWSVEENMNTADCHFLTVQYSMVHEGLYNAGHSKGARGYGCQWGGSPATYHHNLLAHNKSRTCRFNGARGEDYVVFMEYINNVNYNFGGSGGCYGGENTAEIVSYNGLNSGHDCNFINNYYKPGPASNKSGVKFVNSSYARSGARSWAPAQWYVNGNILEGDEAATADNWKAMAAEAYTLDQIRVNDRITPDKPYYKYSAAGNKGVYDPARYMMTDYQNAQEAFNTVVAKAGTINRDKVEQRIAQEAMNGTATYGGATVGQGKGIIDTEADAEGFFAYSTDYEVPVDTDGDGMPDAWETANGLNPAEQDQNLVNINGYTALEVYINSLMGEEQPTRFTSGVEGVGLSQATMGYDAQTRTLSVSPNAMGALLSVFGTDGVMLHRMTVSACQVPLAWLPKGVYLIRLNGEGITPRVLKVRL